MNWPIMSGKSTKSGLIPSLEDARRALKRYPNPACVYIAGPYTHGDVAFNIRAAVEAAEAITAHGHTPYVPHLTHLWHLISPHDVEFWYSYDIVWLLKCNALLRLPGFSKGSDTEVGIAFDAGIPVAYSLPELWEILKRAGYK